MRRKAISIALPALVTISIAVVAAGLLATQGTQVAGEVGESGTQGVNRSPNATETTDPEGDQGQVVDDYGEGETDVDLLSSDEYITTADAEGDTEIPPFGQCEEVNGQQALETGETWDNSCRYMYQSDSGCEVPTDNSPGLYNNYCNDRERPSFYYCCIRYSSPDDGGGDDDPGTGGSGDPAQCIGSCRSGSWAINNPGEYTASYPAYECTGNSVCVVDGDDTCSPNAFCAGPGDTRLFRATWEESVQGVCDGGETCYIQRDPDAPEDTGGGDDGGGDDGGGDTNIGRCAELAQETGEPPSWAEDVQYRMLADPNGIRIETLIATQGGVADSLNSGTVSLAYLDPDCNEYARHPHVTEGYSNPQDVGAFQWVLGTYPGIQYQCLQAASEYQPDDGSCDSVHEFAWDAMKENGVVLALWSTEKGVGAEEAVMLKYFPPEAIPEPGSGG